MTKKETPLTPDTTPEKKPILPDGPASAPELPATVARQYGLHRYHGTSHASPAQPVADQDENPEDEETQAAVDDIVSKEGDAVLEAEDARFRPPEPKKRGFWRTLGRPFAFWWRHKWLRWLTVVVLMAGIGTAAVLPKVRYAVLNKAGVRSSASVTVLDQGTQLPLRNVTVSVGSMTAQTNKEGKAVLHDLRLGPARLSLERKAFAPLKKDVTIGWGSNPLGSFNMDAVGMQYTFTVSDFLSGMPLEGAEATDGGDASAVADKQGKITLTILDVDLSAFSVQVTAPGYRTETVKVSADQTDPRAIALVPSKKTAFISRASGKYDLYTMDVDGQNRSAILPGTGNESRNMSLVVNGAGTHAALVSTRSGARAADRTLLSDVTIVDLATGTATRVEQAAQIQLIDWIGNRLVYRFQTTGADNADPQRYRLVSYDIQAKTRVQLAAANGFNAVVSMAGIVYYAADGEGQTGLYKIKPDGTGRINLLQQEIWAVQQTAYTTLMLQTPERWYTYSAGAVQPEPTDQPTDFNGRRYVENSSSERSLWIDDRDGKGVLMVRTNKTGADEAVQSQEGLVYPVRWLNDSTVIFRVVTGTETADYVKSLHGGEAKKLSDVTNTFGYTW